MSVVLMTGRSGGGGGASGGAAIYDFAAMSHVDLIGAGWTHSRDTAAYVPKADGDYVLKAAGEPFHTTDGIHLPGAFTNYAVNPIHDGAVAGSPGTMPTGIALASYWSTRTITLDTYRGLPLLIITGNTAHAYIPTYPIDLTFPVVEGDVSFSQAYAYATIAGQTDGYFLIQDNQSANSVVFYSSGELTDIIRHRRTRTALAGATERGSRLQVVAPGAGTATTRAAGAQITKNVTLHPSVLALGSGTTTPSSQEKLTLVRPVQTPVSYGVLAKTAAGDPGHDQVIFCHASSASHYGRLIRETSTRKIRWQVVNNGVSVCNLNLGAVADETEFACTVTAAPDSFSGVIDEGEPVTDTSGSPPPNLTTLYLGRHRDDTLPFWGVVRSLEIA